MQSLQPCNDLQRLQTAMQRSAKIAIGVGAMTAMMQRSANIASKQKINFAFSELPGFSAYCRILPVRTPSREGEKGWRRLRNEKGQAGPLEREPMTPAAHDSCHFHAVSDKLAVTK
jgi:hypothetical protein